jgi:hypothetical protein
MPPLLILALPLVVDAFACHTLILSQSYVSPSSAATPLMLATFFSDTERLLPPHTDMMLGRTYRQQATDRVLFHAAMPGA